MKRTILIALLAVVCLAFVSPAFAAEISSPAGTSIGTAAYIPSTGVTVNLLSAASSYCSTAQHASANDPNKGGFQFGAGSGDSVIKSAPANTSGKPTPCTNVSTLPF